MNEDKPKATIDVCIIHPRINPLTIAIPLRLPYEIVCTSTNTLSGPGDNARVAVAKINETNISVFKIIYEFNEDFNTALLIRFTRAGPSYINPV
jgi:hypothetical protein